MRNSLYALEFYSVQIFPSRRELSCLFMCRNVILQIISTIIAYEEGQSSPFASSNNFIEGKQE